MSVLDQICDKKREHVAAKQSNASLDELKSHIQDAAKPLGFIERLKSFESIALITEVKKASPSKGLIRKDFNPLEIAKTYENAGAACLSVLTDEPYFQGRDEYLQTIKSEITIPVLRKDFMVDPYQIYESRALGADCILLIMAALDDSLAADLYELSVDLGMDVLVEVHNEEELERALVLNPAMVGVNNRNLKTLEVDIQTSFDLAEKMPANIIKVAESGLSKHETLVDLQNAGYQAFLVGESLMRQDNISKAVHELSGR